MNKRECGSGNIAKLCICLSIMLLLLSSSPENSFVSALPTGESTCVARCFTFFNIINRLNGTIIFITRKQDPLGLVLFS